MNTINTDKMTVGLHKFLCESEDGVQIQPELRIYLCGMVDRALDVNKHRVKPDAYIVPSIDFEKTIDKIGQDERHAKDESDLASSWLKGFYTCRYTGEFNVVKPVFRGEMPEDIFFPQACFSYARPYAVKLQRFTEGHIFGILGASLEKHAKVLLGFIDQLYSGDFELTGADYNRFKEDYMAQTQGVEKKPADAIPKIKEEPIKELII